MYILKGDLLFRNPQSFIVSQMFQYLPVDPTVIRQIRGQRCDPYLWMSGFRYCGKKQKL